MTASEASSYQKYQNCNWIVFPVQELKKLRWKIYQRFDHEWFFKWHKVFWCLWFLNAYAFRSNLCFKLHVSKNEQSFRFQKLNWFQCSRHATFNSLQVKCVVILTKVILQSACSRCSEGLNSLIGCRSLPFIWMLFKLVARIKLKFSTHKIYL